MNKPLRRLFLLLFPVILILCHTSGCAGEASPTKDNYVSFADAGALKTYLKWRPDREPLISAHRGGPMGGFPENAVETFENALNYGPCLIECDIRLSADNHLVMMHDGTLERTSTGKGKVTDFTLDQLKQLFLKDQAGRVTGYRIPTFEETLQWAKGRAVLTLDVKSGVPFEQVIAAVKKNNAEGHAVIIVYNRKDLKKVHALAPDMMISAAGIGVKGVEKLFASGVPTANLCAFVGLTEPDPVVYQMLHEKGVPAILGTIQNLDNRAAVKGVRVYQELYRRGADIIATDNVLLASRAIKEKQ